MTGFSDSVVFEMNSTILSKLSLFGVVTVAKNGLILDESLLSEFVNKRTIKGKSKQLLELKNLYQYLAILETQWWAATLADELRSALVDQLANSKARQAVALRVDVQRFDSVPGQYALLDVRWRVRQVNGDRPALTCRTTLQSPAGPSIDELVVAHQNNLKRFAALINQTVDTSLKGCPTAP